MLEMAKIFRLFCTVKNLKADVSALLYGNRLIVYGMTVAPIVQWILFSNSSMSW